jgi:hypothetical protein
MAARVASAMSIEREQRVGMNEALFREVNERIDDVNQTFAIVTGTMSIVCECGMTGCVDQIVIPRTDYEQLRADPTLFAVVPGHEIADVEDVIERRDGYDVVRKHPGVPQTIAKATDPRSLS